MSLLLRTICAALMFLGIAYCHAETAPSRGKVSTHPTIGRRLHQVGPGKARRPNFKPGPWKQAQATFYEGGSGTFGGACGYKDVAGQGYGSNTVAVSTILFRNGENCGACYEIKCIGDPKWCKPGHPSLIVTATDHCPAGGWCSDPRGHFDLAKPVFSNIAEYEAGIVPIQFRRFPCVKQGGIRFTINGNPWFYQVLVWNVGGAGDVTSVQVKGSQKLKWTTMERDWGATWKTSAILQGESLTFRVQTSDKKKSTSWHVTPKNWQFGQTFEGKNFKWSTH